MKEITFRLAPGQGSYWNPDLADEMERILVNDGGWHVHPGSVTVKDVPDVETITVEVMYEKRPPKDRLDADDLFEALRRDGWRALAVTLVEDAKHVDDPGLFDIDW